MAFFSKGESLTLDYLDYGLQIPFEIYELDFEEGDKIVFEVKKSKNSGVIFTKEFENQSTEEGTVVIFLEFTKKESESLFPGNYVYYLRHCRDGEVQNTIITEKDFKVR